MAQYKNESSSLVSGSGYGCVGCGTACNYATLAGYHQGYMAGAVAPVAAGVPSMAFAVVPTHGGSPAYSALQHGAGGYTCGGYFPITKAYPNFPNNCTKFTTRLCG